MLANRFPRSSWTLSARLGFSTGWRFCWRLFSLVLALVAWGRTEANVALDWNGVMMAAIRLDNSGPTLSARNLAILHAAIHDAVSSVTRTHQPYQLRFDAPAGTSVEAAGMGAGLEVVRVLYPSARAQADALFETWRRGVPSDEATTNGLALGRAIALATLASRENDGSTTEVPYVPSEAPGQWRRTPPFFRPPLTPHWRYVRPFVLPDLEPFVPGPPPALESAEYARDWEEVRTLGAMDSTVRTAEQGVIAVFWSDFSYTAMPPGHWQEIAATIASDRGASLPETARLLALLSLAQADAAIVCWEAKYRYNLWRPLTAIHRAEEDGNPATEADPAWDHYLVAPPFPAYPSGHSTFSASGAAVLAFHHGTDAITFAASSDALPGMLRTYHSLEGCAEEVGRSRIYGGIHFEFDNRAGKATGRRVAEYVTAHYLLPEDALPLVRMEAVTSEQVAIRVHGQVGMELTLEASADLRTWRPVASVVGKIGGAVVLDPMAEGSRQFYRVRQP